jgi:hypothetical protein
MAVGANSTSLDAAFKQYYEDGYDDLTYKDRPFFALVPKEEGWVGADQAARGWHIPMKYAYPPAVSTTFSVAQAKAATTSSKIQAWELTSKQLYGFIQIDNESLMRSKGNEGAFVELKSLEVNGIIENVSNRLHHYCYGDGTGVIAQVGNSTQMPSFATSVCTLLNSEDTVKIAFGDELTVAATATGAERAFGTNNHGWLVIGTSYDAGTFTVGTLAGAPVNLNDAADGIPTAAASDFIAHRGDRAGTSVNGVISGFQQYIPPFGTTITNTTLYNVDRSQNADWLAGSRIDGSSTGIEEALLRGANVVAKKGGRLEQYFLDHKHYSDLVSALSAKGIVNFLDITMNDEPSIGFKGVKIIGANGDIDVIPDYACPSSMAAGTKISDWVFGSVGEPVAVLNSDGLEFLRLGTADGLEGRFGSYSNLVPKSPRDNCNVLLPL